jgi:hypothetical protein
MIFRFRTIPQWGIFYTLKTPTLMVITLASIPSITLSKTERTELWKQIAQQVEQLLMLKQGWHIDGWIMRKWWDITYTTIFHTQQTRILQNKISGWQKNISDLLENKKRAFRVQESSDGEEIIIFEDWTVVYDKSIVTGTENMSGSKKLHITHNELDFLKNGDIKDVLSYTRKLYHFHRSPENIKEKSSKRNLDIYSPNTIWSKKKNSELFNQSSSIQSEAYIDRLYSELEEFDPECRSWRLQILPSDTRKVKQQKESRTLAYNKACQEFNKKAEKHSHYIRSYYSENPKKAFYQYPENTIIPESNNPMLSLKAYQELCAQIYSKNQQKIGEFVETRYWDRKKFPGAITLDSIKRGFRLVFGNQVEPRPHIIIGWDLENPHIFYVDTDLRIIK